MSNAAVKKIVVFKEKHGERYFNATDPIELNKVFLEIMRERMQLGWYYKPDVDYPIEWTEAMALQEEALDALPESLKSQVHRLRKAYKAREREAQKDTRWWELANELLAMPKEQAENHVHEWTVNLSTGPKQKKMLMATFLMDFRSDGEYEGFEIIELEEREGPKG